MNKYNRSLDHVLLAMACAHKGQTAKAAKLFAKAIQQPDAVRAMAILEASNAAARKTEASANKKVKASDDLDMGEDEDIDSLIEDEPEEASMDDEDDEDFDDSEFASVLASMTKRK